MRRCPERARQGHGHKMRTVSVPLVSQTVGETAVMLTGPCCTFRGAIACDAVAAATSTSVPALAAVVIKDWNNAANVALPSFQRLRTLGHQTANRFL